MKKTWLLLVILCMVCLIGSALVVSADGVLPPDTKANPVFQKEYNYYAIFPDQFTELGGWTLSNISQGSYREICMYAAGEGNEPAEMTLKLPKDGKYYLFVHARDFAENKPASRSMAFSLDGKSVGTFGMHKTEGYAWEKSVLTYVQAGEHTLSVVENSGHARFDLIVITDDPDFFPSNTQAALESMEKDYKFDRNAVQIIKQNKTEGRPNSEIAVKFNEQWMTFDVDPCLMNDRTMVPFRAIFEALGCTVSWKDDTQTAVGIRNGKRIELPIGESTAMVGGKGQLLDQPAVLKDSRTLVPLRFVSEALDAVVEWDNDTQTVFIYAEIPVETIFLTSDSYTDVGTWTKGGLDGGFENKGLTGVIPGGDNATQGDGTETKPAGAPFTIVKGGEYRIWVRSRDYATNKPGSRYFNVGIDNQPMLEQKFGTHGKDGFQWASAGVVTLTPGEHVFYLYDTSGFYARTDAALITEDLDYIPAESFAEITKIASPYVKEALEATPKFPKYAKEEGQILDQTSIENEHTKVVFYKTQTANGQIVQNEIYSKHNGQWVKTNNRTEPLGYLVMFADNASAVTNQNLFSLNAEYTYKGEKDTVLTPNPFKAGTGEWFIPTDYTVENNKVTLLFPDSELGSMTAVWSLDDNIQPLVSVDTTFNKAGYFSVGAFEGDELMAQDVEYVLAPFRYQYKRIPDDVELLNEGYLFTPMGTYTLPPNNKYSENAVTKGVVAEPSWIPLRWVRGDSNLFGMTIKSQSNMCQGGIFAPVMGNPDSKMNAGDTYNLQYRVVSTVADWFTNYENVVTDLFDVTDYRKNYSTSLTQAIFNTRDVILDDKYGGWDPVDKAHYNMEGYSVTSTGNSMQALQDYLLTEDEEMLTRRAIPTLANTLTRKAIHFNRTGIVGGGTYWGAKSGPDPIGTPIEGFNSNVLGGMYEMTHGGVPALLDYTLAKGETEVTNSYGSIATFANDLSMYKYTGEQKYLDAAIEKADKYLTDTVYAVSDTLPNWDRFIYIDYYPNLASLLDIYEVTKDKKYLDAAEVTAQWMSTGLWVPGVDGSRKTDPFTVNELDNVTLNGAFSVDNNQNHLAGTERLRIGGTSPEEVAQSNTIITDRTKEVEGWVASRVGLGIEQASTFGDESKHIIMQCFAGDFMRLSGYTDNPYYATIARNAIIGRFSTYPGYYRLSYMTYDQEVDYPRVGPDYTRIYWHHLPPFLAMIEDFLINQAFAWSGQNISFPSLRQQGYAYFNSNQYGHEAGKFYDEKDMWLWIDEGIIETDSIQIDYIAAKKDGVLGMALMNEDFSALDTTVKLGSKIPNADTFNGEGILYDKNGKIGTVSIVNGTFTVQVPSKAMIAVKIAVPELKKPGFANMEYSATEAEIGGTMVKESNSMGYVLQMTDDCYYAYTFITDLPEAVKCLTMTYSVGGGATQTVTTTQYPYEFIIKVDDVNQEFSYKLTATQTDGTQISRGEGVLMTAKLSKEKGVEYAGDKGSEGLQFEPFTIDVFTRGRSGNNWRYVVDPKNFDFVEMAENVLKGIKVKAVYTHKTNKDDVRVLESVIAGNELRADGNTTLVVPSSEQVSASVTSDFKESEYDLKVTFSPAK